MTDKIRQIKTEPDAMRGCVENLKREMDSFIEYQQVVAKVRRAAYLAHVEEGFTEAQAIELVKKII